MSTDSPRATRRLETRTWLAFRILLYCGLLALAVAVLLPSLGHPPEAHWRSRCRNNVKQIVLALHNYHDVYGTLPPPFTTGEDGQRLHSWRTLILPYLEINSYTDSNEPVGLYDEIRMDEPWDSPHNIEVGKKRQPAIGQFFHCPSDPLEVADFHENVSYLAVVGPRTVWNSDSPVSVRDVIDGASQTIAFVEVADTGIHWMEPRDLHIGQMSLEVNGLQGQGISSYHGSEGRTKHAGVSRVGVLDGAASNLPASISSDLLKQLLTIDDGLPLAPWGQSL